MDKPQIGVIGMAVMGKNLALNIESRGFTVAIFNRSGWKTEKVVADHPDKNLVPSYTIEDFVNSLEKPRRIILMVKAGAPTDATIAKLLPFLEKGDVLIDGGNTFFEDTVRRNKELDNSGINFIGMGVSGGEKGALEGPSLMPGGQKEAYDLVEPILKKIAAKAEDGEPCVSYIGPNGAGHYVKMVHNGIEYGDMELISESYNLLRNLLGLSVEEIADIFHEWKDGELDSYLIDITADILTRKDDEGTDNPIVDMILDRAGNKGTGKWSSQSALELGVPQSLITESVYSRYISALKDERVAASKVLKAPAKVEITDDEKKELIEKIRQALYFSKIMSYAQGFEQMRVASEHYDWNLKYGELAMIWREGCIIRAICFLIRTLRMLPLSINLPFVMLLRLQSVPAFRALDLPAQSLITINIVQKCFRPTLFRLNAITSVLTHMNVLIKKACIITNGTMKSNHPYDCSTSA